MKRSLLFNMICNLSLDIKTLQAPCTHFNKKKKTFSIVQKTPGNLSNIMSQEVQTVSAFT